MHTYIIHIDSQSLGLTHFVAYQMKNLSVATRCHLPATVCIIFLTSHSAKSYSSLVNACKMYICILVQRRECVSSIHPLAVDCVRSPRVFCVCVFNLCVAALFLPSHRFVSGLVVTFLRRESNPKCRAHCCNIYTAYECHILYTHLNEHGKMNCKSSTINIIYFFSVSISRAIRTIIYFSMN